MKKFRYAVLGAGRQGQAIAYDLAVFGNAEEIILIDQSNKSFASVDSKIRPLREKEPKITFRFYKLAFPKEKIAISELLKKENLNACVSGLPYYLNRELAEIALEAKVNFCDLGGNTDIAFEELALHERAVKAGISIIPDCGLMPGAGNILAAYAISKFDECDEIKIYVGGLPQNRDLPLGYKLTFSVEGLINEYSGKANILRDGKIVQIDALTEPEIIPIPDSCYGDYEAFITSGGTSTAPWSFKGKVNNYSEKTIRYKGHLEQIILLKRLGFFDKTPITVGKNIIIPQELLKTLLEKNLGISRETAIKDDKVLFILLARGIKKGKNAFFKIFWKDCGNEDFTAMEKTTGYSAAIVAIMQAKGEIPKGALPPEVAIDPNIFLRELKKRGFKINEEK